MRCWKHLFLDYQHSLNPFIIFSLSSDSCNNSKSHKTSVFTTTILFHCCTYFPLSLGQIQWLKINFTTGGRKAESPYGDPYALALDQNAPEYQDAMAEQPRDAALLLSPTDLKYFNWNPVLHEAFKIRHKTISVEEPNFLSFTDMKAPDLGSDRAKSWGILICC